MTKKKPKVLEAHPKNIEEITHLINSDAICVMPYGIKSRRIFAIVGSAHSKYVINRMLKIKKRNSSDALAISGIPEVAPIVAKLNKTPALVKAAKRIGVSEEEIIKLCFTIGGVGLVLASQDWLPKEVTRTRPDGQRTVLIAGEDTDEEYDIFPKVYKNLIKKFGKVMVGTSANISGDDTYHILEQDKALLKLSPYVDVFIYDRLNFDVNPIFRNLTSTTMIDLTGDRAEVVRWGSVHPQRFRKIFHDLIFEPKKLKKHKGRERLHHVYLRKFFPKL